MDKKILFLTGLLLLSAPLLCGPIVEMNSLDGKSISLSGSSGVVEENISSLYFNPSGLGYMKGLEAGVSYLLWVESSSYMSLYGGLPVSEKLSLGCYVTLFSIDPFPDIDDEGNQTGLLHSNDTMISLGLGYQWDSFHDIKLGVALKYLRTELDESTGTGFGMDLGIMTKFSIPSIIGQKKENLSVGLSFQNIGWGQTYDRDASSLPLTLRLGIAYEFLFYKYLSSQYYMAYKNSSLELDELTSGFEFGLFEMIMIRTGIKWIGRSEDSFNLGLGVKYRISQFDLRLDYGIVPLNDLGTSHTLSLLIKVQ
ncbi:MAG: PorV/PorQ family protein [Spirochaetes bacterium]|nr:PorV/PorQ family protein [Spirochaetota bacterium]